MVCHIERSRDVKHHVVLDCARTDKNRFLESNRICTFAPLVVTLSEVEGYYSTMTDFQLSEQIKNRFLLSQEWEI